MSQAKKIEDQESSNESVTSEDNKGELTFTTFQYSINKNIDQELIPHSQQEDQDKPQLEIQKETNAPKEFRPQSAKGLSSGHSAQHEIELDSSPIEASLQVISLGKKEQRLDLSSKIKIGSDPSSCQVVLEGDEFPALCCIIGMREGKVLIKHSCSKDIHLKQGNVITPNKTYALEAGASFMLGTTLFEVHMRKSQDFINQENLKLEREIPKESSITVVDQESLIKEEPHQKTLTRSLKEVAKIDEVMARRLAEGGISDASEVLKTSDRKLKKILGLNQDQLYNFKKIIHENFSGPELIGGHAKRDQEEQLSSHYDEDDDSDALPVAGVLIRVLAILTNLGLSLWLYKWPVVRHVIDKVDISKLLGRKIFYVEKISSILHFDLKLLMAPLFLFVCLEIGFNLLSGVSFGHWLLGMKTQGSFLSKRIGAILRTLLFPLTTPLVVFDFPLFLGSPSLKERISGSVIKKGYRVGALETGSLIISFFIVALGPMRIMAVIDEQALIAKKREQQKKIEEEKFFKVNNKSDKKLVFIKRIGNVIQVKGSVSRLNYNKEASSLVSGDQLSTHDVVENNQKESKIKIALLSGHTLEMLPYSKLNFQERSDYNLGLIYLEKGCIQFYPSKSEGVEKVMIITQNAQSEARYAEGIVCYNPYHEVSTAMALKGKLKFGTPYAFIEKTLSDKKRYKKIEPASLRVLIRDFPDGSKSIKLDPEWVEKISKIDKIPGLDNNINEDFYESEFLNQMTEFSPHGSLDLETGLYLEGQTPSWFNYMALKNANDKAESFEIKKAVGILARIDLRDKL